MSDRTGAGPVRAAHRPIRHLAGVRGREARGCQGPPWRAAGHRPSLPKVPVPHTAQEVPDRRAAI